MRKGGNGEELLHSSEAGSRRCGRLPRSCFRQHSHSVLKLGVPRNVADLQEELGTYHLVSFSLYRHLFEVLCYEEERWRERWLYNAMLEVVIFMMPRHANTDTTFPPIAWAESVPQARLPKAKWLLSQIGPNNVFEGRSAE